ncbi:MAG: MBL fold metallo-hydrolase, partial [bacterium]|nr:MBL fold metallo-hydrolase [bacterium]
MGLSITVLGCSGSYSAPGLACTGYLVESDTTRVWLDAGPGTLANLQRHRTLEEIDAIVITHEHPDHWLDLAMAYIACRYFLDRAPMPVYGTAGTRALAQALAGAHGLAPTIDWHVISDRDSTTIGDQQWRFSRTDHPVETLAPRVDSGGRTFAFSADTGVGWSFASLGGGIDLGLCEATYLHRDLVPPSPHLSALQAGAMAAKAGVKRLLLTHLAPGSDAPAFGREATRGVGAPGGLVGVGRRD